MQDSSHFDNLEYWNRAWITQEIALARQLTLVASGTELNSELLPNSKNLTELAGLRGRSLVYLLDKFKGKECVIPRDRVFSLLAVCGEGSDLAQRRPVCGRQIRR